MSNEPFDSLGFAQDGVWVGARDFTIPPPGSLALRARDDGFFGHCLLAGTTRAKDLEWLLRLILFHNKRHPSSMGADEVNAWLTHLAVEGHVSAATQNQALSAILFHYGKVLDEEIGWVGDVVRAQKRRHVPVVLTRDEVAQLLERLEGTWWLMGMLLYHHCVPETLSHRREGAR